MSRMHYIYCVRACTRLKTDLTMFTGQWRQREDLAADGHHELSTNSGETQHHSIPHNTTQHHTTPHNTTQHHTIPHITTQHLTIPHNTTFFKFNLDQSRYTLSFYRFYQLNNRFSINLKIVFWAYNFSRTPYCFIVSTTKVFNVNDFFFVSLIKAVHYLLFIINALIVSKLHYVISLVIGQFEIGPYYQSTY